MSIWSVVYRRNKKHWTTQKQIKKRWVKRFCCPTVEVWTKPSGKQPGRSQGQNSIVATLFGRCKPRVVRIGGKGKGRKDIEYHLQYSNYHYTVCNKETQLVTQEHVYSPCKPALERWQRETTSLSNPRQKELECIDLAPLSPLLTSTGEGSPHSELIPPHFKLHRPSLSIQSGPRSPIPQGHFLSQSQKSESRRSQHEA